MIDRFKRPEKNGNARIFEDYIKHSFEILSLVSYFCAAGLHSPVLNNVKYFKHVFEGFSLLCRVFENNVKFTSSTLTSFGYHSQHTSV